MALLPARNILDGTALPVTSQMKTALGSLRDYCSDLLGTDSSNKAAARTALGAAASGALATSGITGAAASGVNTDITQLSALTRIASNTCRIGASGAGNGGNWRYWDDTGADRWIAGILGAAGATAFEIYDSISGATRLAIDSAGAVTVNTPPVGTNSTRVATTAFVASSSIGITQTWQDVTGSRVASTNYTNSTGRPIVVSLRAQQSGASAVAQIVVSGVVVARSSMTNSVGFELNIHTIVPPGAVYSTTVTNFTINSWMEMR